MSDDTLDRKLPALVRAIDGVLIAGHHQRHWLRPDHPPFSVTMAEGLAHYGSGAAFDLWVVSRAIETLRIVWTGQSGETVEQHQATPPDVVEPDEGAPLPSPESPPEEQPRLSNGAGS